MLLANLTIAFAMPTIDQVTKRLFSDKNWLKKCLIGGLLSYPIIQILSFGYLYRIFIAAKKRQEFSLPEWGEWKELVVDGLKVFVIVIVFALIPAYLCSLIVGILGSVQSIFKVLWVPVIFLVGPLSCAALYLYSLREDFKDCFNFSALMILLQKGVIDYAVPTLAFVGIQQLVAFTGLWILMPFFFFFGGVIYFYVMGRIFQNLEVRSS